MTHPDQVLSDFIDAWNSGRRPSVREHLRRVDEDRRDELAEQIATWLEVAPPPPYGEEARAAIRSEPVVRRVLAAGAHDVGSWPTVLPRLRRRAGLGLADVAGRLVAGLGLGGVAEADRAEAYLERMERGELGPDRVSRRLLDALGELLGVSGRSLADLGGRAGAVLRPAAAGGTLFRAGQDAHELVAQDIEVLSRAAMAPAPAPMDELDRLFVGGPEA
jgi:hypothetical protein